MRKVPYELHDVAEEKGYQRVRDKLKKELGSRMVQLGNNGAETERRALARQADR